MRIQNFGQNIFWILFMMFSANALATPPQEHHFISGGGISCFQPAKRSPGDHIDFLVELQNICGFLDAYQVKEQADPEFGGMIEDEYRTGPDRIVQTDNTQEAIFVWSRFHELTGDDSFDQNVDDAWTYCLNHPAWLEEGSGEYYRVWNCGWGLRCAMKYESVYGDDSHAGYAAVCAQYIMDHADDLPFEASPPNVGVRNALTLSWSAWNLNEYADFVSNDTFRLGAEDFAGRIKLWLESDPENINKTGWALSGGISAACVLDVLFPDDPESAAAWRDSQLVDLNEYYDPAGYGTDAWVLAWDSWQSLAQNALWRTTGDFRHRRVSFEQSDYIRSFDTDSDGGIPPNPLKPDTEDETWVSTYVILMGFADLTEPPDLRFAMDSTNILPGDPLNTYIQIYGPGLDEMVDLYILLEIGSQFLFYPAFTGEPAMIVLDIKLDFDLAEWVGLSDWVPILSIPEWPHGVPPATYSWWGGLIRHGTAQLLGDVIRLDWTTH
ncbi:hypothetical protein JXA40_10575 [bacterium]|nr:hypothetical protein [candidate division CSSED10-310 bacterium]